MEKALQVVPKVHCPEIRNPILHTHTQSSSQRQSQPPTNYHFSLIPNSFSQKFQKDVSSLPSQKKEFYSRIPLKMRINLLALETGHIDEISPHLN
jgi:hypothetical protein